LVKEKSIRKFPTPEVDPENPTISPEVTENVGASVPVPASSSPT
jgi:hypothetical protein